jgi:chemotaxis protein MotD
MSPVRTLTIELHPAELGVVTARLRLAGGVLSVKLSASRPATARLLKQEESPLRELLGADGHAVEIGDVNALSAGQQPNKPIGQPSTFGGSLSPGGGWQPSTSSEPGPGNRQAYRERAEDDRSEPKEGDNDPPSSEHPGNIYV